MEPSTSTEEFKVSIRRKNLTEKMSIMRATITQIRKPCPQKLHWIVQVVANNDPKVIMNHVSQLLSCSYDKSCMELMLYISPTLLQIASEVTSLLPQYNQLIEILINITSLGLQLPLQYLNLEKVFLKIIRNILNQKRQMVTLWLLANLLYHHQSYTAILLRKLLDCDLIVFIQERLDKQFNQNKSQMVFSYFCCSLLSLGDNLDYKQYQALLKVLKRLQTAFGDQVDFNIAMSLVEHAPFIYIQNYAILSSPLLDNFKKHCCNRTTKLIRKYLEAMYLFIRVEVELINSHQIKKLRLSYERMLLTGLYRNLEQCLSNRHPGVKIICFKIGSELLKHYIMVINLNAEEFYRDLLLQVKNINKVAEYQFQMSLLQYLIQFMISLKKILSRNTIDIENEFANFLADSQILSQLGTLLVHSQQPEILRLVLQIISRLSEWVPAQLHNSFLYNALNSLLNKVQCAQSARKICVLMEICKQ